MISKQFTLNREELHKWRDNVVAFLAPLGVIYFGSVLLALRDVAHGFSLSFLIPNEVVIGSMVLYVANVLYDLSRKFASGGSK